MYVLLYLVAFNREASEGRLIATYSHCHSLMTAWSRSVSDCHVHSDESRSFHSCTVHSTTCTRKRRIHGSGSPVFLSSTGEFRPEKHDLETTFHGKKKTQVRQNSKKKLNPSSQILMISSSLGSPEHGRILFLFLSTFISGM